MDAPLILFGAFDRHNLGDLLLAEVAAALARPRPVRYAGLAARDMRPYGGAEVGALREVLATWPERYGKVLPELVHVGGEILSTTAWEAAVMLRSPPEAAALIRARDAEPGREAWAQAQLGAPRPLPYVLGRADSPLALGRLEFRAVGGVALESMSAEARAQALAALRSADAACVRDVRTQLACARLDLALPLAPDPVEALPGLLGHRVVAAARRGAASDCRHACPQGYAAVQFAAQHGTDAGLAGIASVLESAGLPVVLFQAGAAPWHDAAEAYRRLMARLSLPALLFPSVDIWQLTALIAGSTAVFATSLHARLLARAYGGALLPLPAGLRTAKVAAYEETWGGSG